ncbi:hypothetical protein CIB84_015432 [Bambusicola thoracicus]|uniref:Uncharacterized protein n=1 Tax=Bambusicola thoracicus TaxID=9083 RepID=A0A2P4S9N6_BAMTH|nr:hypothetical protein CIB84_015432 [Bambusicola thoracicus]
MTKPWKVYHFVNSSFVVNETFRLTINSKILMQKVQSTKRKREGSPTAVRRKGQQKTEETPVKKAKR